MLNRIQRFGFALLTVALVTAGCTLGDSGSTAPTMSATNPLPTVGMSVPSAEATGSLVITPMVETTAQAALVTATGNTNVQAVPVTGTVVNQAVGAANTCTPRTGWVSYTVQQGDTVGTLATQAGVSIQDLVTANCLANADVITVGQVIYLPGTVGISGNTAPLPANTAVVSSGGGKPTVTVVGPAVKRIWVEPALIQNNGQFQVNVGSTITLRAEGVTNATKVTFVLAPVGTNVAPTTLGVDTNLADEVSVAWRVTDPNLRANLWAIATSSANANTQTDPIVIFAGPAQ
jgi:LysM repeat protein